MEKISFLIPVIREVVQYRAGSPKFVCPLDSPKDLHKNKDSKALCQTHCTRMSKRDA